MAAVKRKKHEDEPDGVKGGVPQGDELEKCITEVKKLIQCPICLETITDAYCYPDCVHHFCGTCIKQSLQDCNHECPICRKEILTPRALRKDQEFDDLVSIFPLF